MFARPLRLRRIAPAVVVVVAAAAAIVLVRKWPQWQTARLADIWRDDLETAEPDRIAVLIDQLVDLGDAGLEPLITALASPRGEVRLHATAALRRLVDRWELADISARSVAAGKLAAVLARHVEKLDSDARQSAATLVQQLLVWTFDDEFVDRTRLVLDCEAVLLAADEAGEPSHRVAAAEVARRSAPAPLAEPVPPDRDLAMLARLPGGGLEIEPSQPPRLPPVNETPPPTATGDPNEPRLLLDGRGDELSPAPLPAVHAEDAALVNPASANIDGHKPSIPANDAPRDNRAGNADIADAPAPAPLAELVPRANLLGPATPREMSLVRLLRSEPSIITVEAEQQLLAIGYGEREISLAYSITHPDVDFRLRLVDALPRTDGIRPRRWLEMLLDDDDPQVRLAAMTQLATSGDAALVESLRRRAIADPDPSVRRYAERLRISRSR